MVGISTPLTLLPWTYGIDQVSMILEISNAAVHHGTNGAGNFGSVAHQSAINRVRGIRRSRNENHRAGRNGIDLEGVST